MNRSSDRRMASQQQSLWRKLAPFVRPHLAALQRQIGDHPDANLLLAFTERNLSRGEHTEILAHLAECPECREILALSSGVSASEAGYPGFFRKSRMSWQGWGLAATAALVCSVIALVWRPALFKHSPAATSSSRPITISRPPSSVPEPPVAQVIERSTAKPQVNASRKKQASPRRDAGQLAQRSPAPLLVQRADEAEKFSEPLISSLPGEIQTAPPPSAVAAVQSGTTDAVTQLNKTARAGTIAPAAPAKNLIMPNSIFSSARSAAPVRTFLRAQRSNEKTVWSLEASPKDGTVQKSDDGGKTWHIIPVNEGTRFYALCGTGPNVWVGGTDGKLFHSVDNGVHWTAIPIGDEGSRLTAAIIGIDARGESITLKTDSGTTWKTDDGGMHWHVR